MTQTSSSSHPAFYARTRDVTTSMGLTPGFPQQFSYLEIENHPTQVNSEYANVWVNPQVGIRQNGFREAITGRYRSMVDDVPFNPTGEARTRNRLAAFGLAALALGT